jgi:hypothetical protein
MDNLHVGDIVLYRPGFGSDTPRLAIVQGLTVTAEPRSKYGEDATAVTLDQIRENRVVFDLVSPGADGHWAYSEQIDGISPSITSIRST